MRRLSILLLALLPLAQAAAQSMLTVDAVGTTAAHLTWRDDDTCVGCTPKYIVQLTPENEQPVFFDTLSGNDCWFSGLQPLTNYFVDVCLYCPLSDRQGLCGATGFFTTSDCDAATIGQGFGTNSSVPVSRQYGNSISQSIYTAAELQAAGLQAGDLCALQMGFTANTLFTKELTILLGNTSAGNANALPVNPATHTQVYGPAMLQNTEDGYHIYPFNTPFHWDGVSNVVMTTIVNQPTGIAHNCSWFYGYSTNYGQFMSRFGRQDNIQFDVATYSSMTHPSNVRPNVVFYPTNCQQVDSCPEPLLYIDDKSAHHLCVAWMDDSTGIWDIAYRQQGQPAWSVAATQYGGSRYCLYQLQNSTTYEVRLSRVCDSIDTVSRTVSATTYCQDTYFNYADLHAHNVTCRYGTFHNPDNTIGIVDYGYASQYSRHTIHTDVQETDPRTLGLLHTVPDEHCASVRIGNWDTGAEAESITYTFTIDTNDYDLLLLKYAAVMEDPNHTPAEQPRFTFRFTDSQGQDISSCYNADFVSSQQLGWQQGQANVLWKDWTTVGVDLSPLHGQTINIKLTTYDCSQSGHYGYAYFVIDADNKNIRSSSCSSEEVTFYAPKGFAYRWYEQDSTQTLSTADTLHVTRAGNFCCDLSFVGAPADSAHANCHFTAYAQSGERHPWARFDAVPLDSSSCSSVQYRMYNRSIITRDSAHTDSIGNDCEDYLWLFDDGTRSTEKNPRHGFTPGFHTVTLCAYLANGNCCDSASVLLLAEAPCLVVDTIYDTICKGESYRLFDTVIYNPGIYHRDTVRGEYSAIARTLYLTQQPTYRIDFYDTCIENDLPRHFGGHIYTTDTIDTLRCVTQYGCDSTVNYYLVVYRNADTTFLDSTVCDSLLWYGQWFKESGTFIHTDITVHGADSVIVLHLTVNHAYPTSVATDVSCRGDVHFRFAATTEAPYTLWQSEPNDTSLIGHEHDSIVYVNPRVPTQYVFTADSLPQPVCPTIVPLSVTPIDTLHAIIGHQPPMFDDLYRQLTFSDRSIGLIDQKRWTFLYNDSPAGEYLQDNVTLLLPDEVEYVTAWLVVSNTYCTDTAYAQVFENGDAIHFPNVFTPQQDINNTFHCLSVGVGEYELWIYDRLGDLVFHSTDINEGWNGTHKGRLCKQASYAYVCKYKTVLSPTTPRRVAGVVTLLR